MNFKRYIFIFSILFLFLDSKSQFFGIYSYYGGNIEYEINSPLGVNGIIYSKTDLSFNCSNTNKWYYGFKFYNYPMVIPEWHDTFFVHEVFCNAHCLSNPPINSARIEGVYKRYYSYATVSTTVPNPQPGIPFIGQPPANYGWVIATNGPHYDTTASNIQYILSYTSSGNAYLPKPIYWTRAYQFPQGMIPFNDSSPRFLNDHIFYATAGDTLVYDPGLYDPDGDSLTIHWDYPIWGFTYLMINGSINIWPVGNLPSPITNSSGTHKLDTVQFKSGYAYNNPLPDQTFNSNNIPATLDTNTGEIYFCCHNPGKYYATIKVSSYRNGHLLNDVHRDLFFAIYPSNTNHNPEILNAGVPFSDTIYAGDSISIPFTIHDADAANWVNWEIMGYPLDSALSPTGTGCQKPPCAGLSVIPADSFHSQGFGIFKWNTSCNHVSYSQNAVTYNFIIKAKDNHCPIPGMAQQGLKITVIRPPKLPAPELHCAAVDSSGNVLLSWSPVVDSLGRSFRFYRIWCSHYPDSGYVAVDSVLNINTTGYLHQGAGADSDTLFYVIETVSGCHNMFSAFSDTLATIFLNLQNNGNGSALLTWNEIRDSANGTKYRIWRSVNGGGFVLIDSTLSLSCLDTVSVCSLPVSYYITLSDSSGCDNRSNIRSSVFEDKISPQGVVLDTVSVNTSNHPLVGWIPSPSPDVNRYVILRGGTAVDTVAASPFVDISISGSDASYCYAVAAMDSCGNVSDTSAVRCSIRLAAYIDKCNRLISLSWNDNQDSVSQGFEVWASLNGASYVLLASLSSGITQFVHSKATPHATYCYFIRKKLSGSRSSSSNRLCLLADFTPAKGFAYLRVATVANTGEAVLRIFSDTAVPLKYFTVQHSSSNGFSDIGQIPWSAGISNFNFTDASALTQKQSYRYRIITIDSCNTTDTTNTARTVFLKTIINNTYSNRLIWNDYGDWNAGTDYYLIHRVVESVEVFPSINIPYSAVSNNTYLDDVSDFGGKASLFCYFIEAVEGQGNTITGQSDSSFSNLSCLLRPPLIVVPNAFTPVGKNPVFKPVIPYLKGSSYNMIIFNRWGQKLFESEDVNNGWDGSYQGKTVPQGVYSYIITVTDRHGSKTVKRGEVVVVR